MSFFFFQAEDGIRDLTVTGVQTCALPISADCVVIVTDHSDVDYALVERCARLVVDTRNVLATVRQRRGGPGKTRVSGTGAAGSGRGGGPPATGTEAVLARAAPTATDTAPHTR